MYKRGNIDLFSPRFVYNTAVHSGIFDYFRRWILAYTPPDTRIILLIIGYSFGALLEGKESQARSLDGSTKLLNVEI